MNRTTIAAELLEVAKIVAAIPGSNTDYPAPGYYVAEKPFRMGMGAWFVGVRNIGTIFRVNRDTSLYRWVPENSDFVAVRGASRDFRFQWNGTYMDLDLVAPFLKNTRKLSDAEFKKMTQDLVVEGTMPVKRAIELLQKQDPEADVFIRMKRVT